MQSFEVIISDYLNDSGDETNESDGTYDTDTDEEVSNESDTNDESGSDTENEHEGTGFEKS